MLTADVGITATENLLEELKNEIFKRKIKKPEDAKSVLAELMVQDIDYDVPKYEYPLVILLSGVNGVGKTTAIGKLAHRFKEEGKSVVVAAADTFRAAASEQLEVWGQRAGVRVIRHSEGADPAAVVFDAISSAKAKGNDVVLIDTAGRLHNKRILWRNFKRFAEWWIENFPRRTSANISCLTQRLDKTRFLRRKFSVKTSTLTASFSQNLTERQRAVSCLQSAMKSGFPSYTSALAKKSMI